MTAVVLALGRADMLVRISIIFLVATVPAILLGIPWGILGVATMMTLSAIVITALWMYRVGKQVHVTFTDYRLAVIGVLQATGIMALAVAGAYVILVGFGAKSAATLAACIAVGIGVYIPACRWRAPNIFNMIRDLALEAVRRRRAR
jgi:O-antigen/teichoic acid export membrane protein